MTQTALLAVLVLIGLVLIRNTAKILDTLWHQDTLLYRIDSHTWDTSIETFAIWDHVNPRAADIWRDHRNSALRNRYARVEYLADQLGVDYASVEEKS